LRVAASSPSWLVQEQHRRDVDQRAAKCGLLAHARPRPRPAAAPPGQRSRGPAAHPAVPPPRRSPPPCARPCADRPDHHCRHGNAPFLPAGRTVADAQFKDLCGAHASLEPLRGEAPAAGTSFGSQPGRAAGGSRATPAGTSQRYDPAHFHPGQARTAYPKSQFGRFRARYPAAIAHIALQDGWPGHPSGGDMAPASSPPMPQRGSRRAERAR